MEGLRRIRETKEMTTLIILKELAGDPSLKASRLSEKLGISIQAASDYLKDLQMAGFIRREAGGYRLTELGVLRLQRGIEDLRDFLHEALVNINTVEVVEAIAVRDLKEGERVNLFMEGGFLMAGGEEHMGSEGVVVEDSKRGELVRLKGLEGILQHTPGELLLVSLTSYTFEEGKAKMLLERLKEMSPPGVLIPLDERGRVFLKHLEGRGLLQGHQMLPPVGVPYLALVKGISAALVGRPDSVKDAVRFIHWAEREFSISFSVEELLL